MGLNARESYVAQAADALGSALTGAEDELEVVQARVGHFAMGTRRPR